MKALLVTLLLVLAASNANAQGKLKWVRTNHPTMTSALSFSTDDKILASIGDATNEIILWDAQSGKYLSRLYFDKLEHIGGAEFIGDDVLMLGGDSAIYYFNINTRSIEGSIVGYETMGVWSIDRSPAGDTLLWLANSKLYWYDQGSGKIFDSVEIDTWRRASWQYFASKDLRTILFRDRDSDYNIYIRNPDSTIRFEIDPYQIPVSLSSDGDYVILNNLLTGRQDSLSLPSMQLTEAIQEGERADDPGVRAYSHGSQLMAFADNRNSVTPEYGVLDGYVMLVRGADTVNITGLVGEIALSPVVPEVTVAGPNGIARYGYDGDQIALGKKSSRGSGIRNIAYSSTGEFTGISLGDIADDFTHTIHVGGKSYTHYIAGWGFNCFNTPKIDPVEPRFALGVKIYPRDTAYARMTCPVVTAEWTPSGSHYVWSAYNDTLVLQDRNNERSYYPSGHRTITSIAVSRDGLIATGGVDSLIRIWRTDGSLVTSFSGHTAPVNDVNFAPNGRQLVSASSDTTVRVWDLEAGEIFRYTEFKEPFTQAAVSNDGLTVVAATPLSVVGFDASGWASVRKQPANSSTLVATRTPYGITLKHDLGDERPVLVEIYDLLGRMLYRGEHVSSEGALTVASSLPRALLLVRVSSGGRSASLICAM